MRSLQRTGKVIIHPTSYHSIVIDRRINEFFPVFLTRSKNGPFLNQLNRGEPDNSQSRTHWIALPKRPPQVGAVMELESVDLFRPVVSLSPGA